MWELEYNGTRQELDEWGIKNLRRTLLSLDIDTVTFDIPGAAIDAADIFERGGTIRIYRNNVQWFVGRIEETPRTASGRTEGHQYLMVGPWWYLENLVFQQSWKELSNPLDPSAGLVSKYCTHVILGVKVDGSYQTTKAQVQEAIQYAIDSGAPFQIGEIDMPEFHAPTMEVLDRMCAEIIHQELRWSPDVMSWFDYSTTPPTLHLKKRSALQAVTVAVSSKVVGMSLRPRHDLKVPAVVIKYEIANVIDGFAYPVTVIDKAPESATGREFGALVSTINLEGFAIAHSTAEITCEAIQKDSVDWWKARVDHLGKDKVTNLVIKNAEAESALANELTSGDVPPWMLVDGKAAARGKVTAKADYDLLNDEGLVIEKKRDVELAIEITFTNLTTGTYRTSQTLNLAEGVPQGLAAYLYAATNTLHYDGQVTLKEEECTSTVGIGHRLNVSGAKAEYAAMNGVVYSVAEDVDMGTTQIQVGPPKHLGKDDIINLLRMNRTRVRSTAAASVGSGKSYSATPTASGKHSPIANTTAGLGSLLKLVLGDLITIDVDDAGGMAIKLRTVKYCLDGREVYITGLFSPLHTNADLYNAGLAELREGL